MTGTIKTIVADRGFGFITAEGGKDVFFHRSQLAGGTHFSELQEGDRVKFDSEQSPKGRER